MNLSNNDRGLISILSKVLQKYIKNSISHFTISTILAITQAVKCFFLSFFAANIVYLNRMYIFYLQCSYNRKNGFPEKLLYLSPQRDHHQLLPRE
jgi:uncharacterized membrane protein